MANEYVQRNPLQPNGRFLRAQLGASLGNLSEAVFDFGCLLYFQEQPTLMPVDYQQLRIRACKFLGEYWMSRDYKKLAVEIMRMALAIGKGETVAGVKLASLYFGERLYAECLQNLRFAEQLDVSAPVLLSLGKVLIMLNDGRGALAVLEKGVRSYPLDQELQRLLSDLRGDLGKRS
jgi:tetratricopeptide (TPR) repeat protein